MSKCMTSDCKGMATIKECRGLCINCQSKAKKLVASGQTTWEELEEMGLVGPANLDPFTTAFNQRKGHSHAKDSQAGSDEDDGGLAGRGSPS